MCTRPTDGPHVTRNRRMKIAFTTAAFVNFAVLVAALLLAYLNQEMFWDNFILATVAFSIIGASLLGFIIAAVVYILRSKHDRVAVSIPSRNNHGGGYQHVPNSQGPYGKQLRRSSYNTSELIDNDSTFDETTAGRQVKDQLRRNKEARDNAGKNDTGREYAKEDSCRNYISDLDEISSGVTVEFTQQLVGDDQ